MTVAHGRSVASGKKVGGMALGAAGALLLGAYLLLPMERFWPIRRYLQAKLKSTMALKPQMSPQMAKLPRVYLWAWERPENLQFLAGHQVGVAFLAKTIYLPAPLSKNKPRPNEVSSVAAAMGYDEISVRPRLQPLRITPGTPLMAVVRIETLRAALPSNYTGNSTACPFSKDQLALAAAEIASAAQITGVSAIQIDFDATLSEHTFYRDLLIEVRRRLPADIPLSVTALASWCIGDRWLEQLPPGTIDEAVPMLFRMGAGEREIAQFISLKEEFRVAACNDSVGVATDEPISQQILAGKIAVGSMTGAPRRIYIFSPSAWNQQNAETVLKEIQPWHANQ